MISELEQLRRRVNDLSMLLDTVANIAQDMRLGVVLNRVVHEALSLTSAEAGTLWLADEQQSLAPVVIIGGASKEQLAKMRLAPGEGVAGRVYESGQPLLIADVHSHPRWASRFDNATGFQTRSIICTPMIARGRRLGSLQLVNKVSGGLFNENDLFMLVALANQTSLIVDASLMLQQSQALTNSLVEAFAGAVDDRVPWNRGHSVRVAEYSMVLGRVLGMQAEELEKLRRAALLHNIGMIGVPEAILRKVAALTPEEEKMLQAHTGIGAEILSKVKPAAAVHEAVLATRHHHERVDGAGYPDGLIGEQASLFARIIAVADAFFQLTHDRPGKKAISFEEALAELARSGATLLDARLASLFAETMLKAKQAAATPAAGH